jgi:hypothetical protein
MKALAKDAIKQIEFGPDAWRQFVAELRQQLSATELRELLVPPELLSKKDLAQLLGITPWSLNQWRRDPKIGLPACIWLSSTTPRWRRSDIETWLASRQRGGLAPSWSNTAPQRQTRRKRRQGSAGAA